MRNLTVHSECIRRLTPDDGQDVLNLVPFSGLDDAVVGRELGSDDYLWLGMHDEAGGLYAAH